MNRDQIEGKGKEAMGGARQTAGDLTGNREQQARGAAQRTGGKAQGGLAGIMEKLKGIFKRG